MIIDTSALVAMFSDEPERARFLQVVAPADRRLVAAGSWIEFGTVLTRKYRIPSSPSVQADFAGRLGLTVSPLDERQTELANAGYATFGRGTGHRARLNFGDCFAYALAKATGEPLLFKGDDFNHTDLLLHEGSSFPR